MNIVEATARHSAWVGEMGWHDKSTLEYLALIGSEIGEAVAEAPKNCVTPEFGSELMDIVLRVIDCAYTHDVILLQEVARILEVSSEELPTYSFGRLAAAAYTSEKFMDPKANKNPSVLERLADILPDLANAMNDCRKHERAPSFGRNLTLVLLKALCYAHFEGIDVDATISAKLKKNFLKGNKGRIV
jgi:NTP pyrophosphatase (non-canonical NTP hydrolase)